MFNNDVDYYWYTEKIYETSTVYITTKNELAGKLTVVYKKWIRSCNHMSTAIKTSFSFTQNVGFLILNWGGRLMQTEQLIDCSLSKKRMQNADKLLIKTDKLLCYTLMIKAMIDHLKKFNIGTLNPNGVDKG